MKAFNLAFLGRFLFLFLLAAAPLGATETLQSLIQKVDDRLYYPQREGLRTLQADARYTLLEQMLREKPESKDFRLTFYWSHPFQHRLVVGNVPDAVRRKLRVLDADLQFWSERLVPKPLALRLADYRATLRETETLYLIDALTTSPSAPFSAMQYSIDKKTLLPVALRVAKPGWEAVIHVRFARGPSGKHLPVEVKTYSGGSVATLNLKYKKVGDFILAELLTMSHVGADGKLLQSDTFQVSKHKINEPIPDNIFSETRYARE